MRLETEDDFGRVSGCSLPVGEAVDLSIKSVSTYSLELPLGVLLLDAASLSIIASSVGCGFDAEAVLLVNDRTDPASVASSKLLCFKGIISLVLA
jgi:hypothetical protein